jgi:hypothetical protein
MNEKTEMYLSIQLGKNVGGIEYGLYEIDGFLSCFKGKDGSVKPKLIVTSAKPTTKYEKKETPKEDDPYTSFAKEIEINDNFLDD